MKQAKNKISVKNCQRGVSAVEFALIAPVMVAMLFGAVEISQAVTTDRKVSIAASTIADLVAQDAKIDCPGLASAFAVTREIFAPSATHGAIAQISVASVVMDAGTPKVEWSRVVNADLTCSAASNFPVGSVVSVTDGGGNLVPAMIPAGGGIIVGDVSLNYVSLGTSFMASATTMQERFFLRPRSSEKVCFQGIITAGCS